MELEKRKIHSSREKCRGQNQLTIDEDVNIPDVKPDILKIVQEKTKILIEEVTTRENEGIMRGKLQYGILYKSDGKESSFSCLTGQIPFEETLHLEGAREYERVQCSWTIEDVSISIINSRKINLKSLLMMEGKIMETATTEVIEDTTAPEDYKVLKQESEVLQLVLHNKDTCRFKDVVILPSNKPNVSKVLWENMEIRGLEAKIEENQISVKGEALVFLLYTGEEEERLQWMETAVPLQSSVVVNGITKEMIGNIHPEIVHEELDIREDVDGEAREIHMEAVVELDMEVYEEEKVVFWKDLYSLKQRLLPTYQKETFERLLMKNDGKCKVTERISLDKAEEKLMQILSSECAVTIEKKEIVKNGLNIEGILHLSILYITADDNCPLASLKKVLYFHHNMEIPGIHEKCRVEVTPSMDQLTTVPIEASQVEMKAVVNLNAICFEQQEVENLTEIVEMPADEEERRNRPGMIGYIGEGGEALFPIAKESYTTVEEIQEINHRGPEKLQKGERILIIKEIVS